MVIKGQKLNSYRGQLAKRVLSPFKEFIDLAKRQNSKDS